MTKFVVDGEVPINKIRNSSNSDDVETKDVPEDINHKEIAGHTFLKEIKSLQKSNSFLKRVVLFLLLIITIAVCFLGYLGSLSKTDLAVIHTSGNNEIINASMARPLNNVSSTGLSTYFIEQFVENARAVSVDQIVNNSMRIEAFSYLQGQAYKSFKQYLMANNPSEISKDSFVEITINSVLPNVGGSTNTTQISWTETKRSNDTNEIVSSNKYTAQLSFRLDFASPSNEVIRQYNPLGFYITNITWTRNYSDN